MYPPSWVSRKEGTYQATVLFLCYWVIIKSGFPLIYFRSAFFFSKN